VSASKVQRLARECGFDLAGVAPAAPSHDWPQFMQWLANGNAGEMAYLTDHRARLRSDPRSLLPSARSIICVAKSYNTGAPSAPISRYARSEDYHEVLRRDLEKLAGRLQYEFGAFDYRICVDTAPLLERSYAREAGLGWIGRNTCLINQQKGSYLFLGEMLVSLDLDPGVPAAYRCGTCTRCIDACPTSALIPTGTQTQLDSRRCISYLTIELRGPIPTEARPQNGHLVFGCDICQEVCPWNGKADATAAFTRESEPDLESLARLTPEEFRTRFRRTPLWRTKYAGLLRNVAVAMGNSGDERYRPALETLAASLDPVVVEHAQWALARLAEE
jgi:epoxyqueuosine reductase